MTNDVAIAIREFMVGRLKNEIKTTKKVIQAIPEDKGKSSYKHEPKSRTAWELAWHLAGVDVHFLEGIPDLSFASMANEGEFLKKNEPQSVAAMAEWYEKEMERVIGRVRNLLTLPNGEQRYPDFGVDFYGALEPVSQFQIVQKTRRHLELRVVTARPPTPEEEAAIKQRLNRRLGHEFEIRLVLRNAIPRGPGGKYEEFMSELA